MQILIDDGNKIIIKPLTNDLNNKNTNLLIFTNYENNLCSYSNFLYENEKFKYQFDSYSSMNY